MIGRFAAWSHSSRESVGERKNPFRGCSVGALPTLRFDPLLKGGDYRRRETLSSEASEFRSQCIRLGVLKIQALQNSTSRW
jgi:hypothetical protein